MEDQLLFFGILSFDAVMGMALGMIASPLLMKAVKVLRNKRKINKLLKDIAKTRTDGVDDAGALPERAST